MQEARDRAQKAWTALKNKFGSCPNYPNIFAEALAGPASKDKCKGDCSSPSPSGGNVQATAGVWTQSEVVRAALDLANLTLDYSDFNRIAPTLNSYRLKNCGTTGYAPLVNPDKCCPPPARYWDDNGIVALVLLQASAQLGGSNGPGSTYLQKVQNLWPFIRAGQYPSSGSQWPGGGQRENEAKSFDIVSTGATSVDDQSMEQLYLATNASDPLHNEYLNFVLANDAAIKAKVRAPGGLYWDGYRPDNACDATDQYLPTPPPGQTPTTTNVCAPIRANAQGLMIGSDVLLYRITNDSNYLQSAKKTADAALNYYTPCSLWFQTPIFIADYFTGLFQLDQYSHDPRILCSFEAYLDCAWNYGRDPNNLFNKNNIGGGKFGSNEQAAFVIMYSLLASVSKNDDCSSVPKAWSALIKAYTARDRTTYAAALECLRTDIAFGGTAEVSHGVSIGHFCSNGNNSITGTFPTGKAIVCANLPSGVVAYSDNFATCTGSCGAP